MTARRREPAALLGVPVVRLGAFALLGAVGVGEWTRMVDGLSLGRGLLWVALGVAAGAGIWACDRLSTRRWALGAGLVMLLALAGTLPAAGLDLGLLRPSRWVELASGLSAGADALATARLPYAGANPWPSRTLALLGAFLCVVAGALALWPRPEGGGRGYPFFSLAVLLTLAATPVVSIGGPRPLLLGVALAALTVAFLWLERLPLRPGFGAAALVGVALAGALPLAGAADRDAPWFDYRAFAEGVGPDRPVRFDWEHSYGPIDWPRERREILRVRTPDPQYWKARTLDDFSGEGWSEVGVSRFGAAVGESDLPARQRPEWVRSFDVSIRQLRSTDVVAAGTTLGVSASSRRVVETEDGEYTAPAELRRGDSYRARAYVPAPTREELGQSTVGGLGRQADELVVRVPFRDDVDPDRLPRSRNAPAGATPVYGAEVTFGPFASGQRPRAFYPQLGRGGSGDAALSNSTYARTWRLAQSLRSGAATPFAYVAAVDAYLHGPDFTYSERPAEPGEGEAPLDAFLIDTHDGYCQHYAGAMALLLRMGGVPARVASGFSPGGYSKRRGEWIVRDTDAHSWVEAWFDDYGWVTFDPTPAATPARSQIAALPQAPADPSARDAGEAAERADADGAGGPGKVGDGLKKDAGLDPASGAAAEGADAASGAGGGGGVPWLGVVGGGAGLAALGAGGFALWRRRSRAVAGTPLDRAVAEIGAAFRRSGRPAPPGTTLRQLEAQLAGSPEAIGYLRALQAARYGADAPAPTAAQRRAVRRELAYGLGWTGRLRALWALPPRRG